jgi:hypothetical protein
MKTYPPTRRRKARHPRVPAFVPVLQRARSDGWSPERQAHFLAQLAITRSVSAAARAVGMARETAYRLRARPGAESFAAAWDCVLGRAGPKRKVTFEERRVRAMVGLIQPRIYRGKCTAIVRKADNSALLAYLADLDRFARDRKEDREWSQSFVRG